MKFKTENRKGEIINNKEREKGPIPNSGNDKRW